MNPFLAALAVIVVTFLLATGINKHVPPKAAVHSAEVQSASTSATPTMTEPITPTEIQTGTLNVTPTPQQNNSQSNSNSHCSTNVTVNGKVIPSDGNCNVNYDEGGNSVHVNGSTSNIQSDTNSSYSSSTNVTTNINTGNK